MKPIEPVAADALPDEKTFLLRKPISFAGEEFTSITLREPTAGQMRQWDGLTGYAADVRAISVVGGVVERVADQILARDLRAMSDYIAAFL